MAFAILGKHLQPLVAKPAARESLTRWVAQLDDPNFAVRQQAFDNLAAQAELAEVVLQQALKSKPPLELYRRLEQLHDRIRHPERSPEFRQQMRALEVLEWLGTADARKVVERVASGRPDAALSREAQATLKRFKK